jgi:hypothetical protein
MTVACYLDQRPAVAELMRLFARGCGGVTIDHPHKPSPYTDCDDHAVVAKGIAEKLVPAFRRHSLPFWYIDSAYIQIQGRREYRIERNRGWPPSQLGRYSIDRALAMGVELQPWRKQGSKVVICLPGPGAGKDFDLGMDDWANDIRGQVKQKTDRQLVVRPKVLRFTRPLADDLHDAWCVVAHSSTAAVEAVIAGVPIFVAATNPAAPVGRLDLEIECPLRPEREDWLAALAWRQWTRHEISSGQAWAHITERETP